MIIANTIGIPPTHPALAGHFPGNPIVPGVLLLEELLCAAEECYGRPITPNGIPNVKFLAPLLPGTPFSIEFQETGNSLKFTCTSMGKTIASGRFDFP